MRQRKAAGAVTGAGAGAGSDILSTPESNASGGTEEMIEAVMERRRGELVL